MSIWPQETFSNLMRQRKEFVTIDDCKEYKRCRVKLHASGIVLRDIVEGSHIKTKKQQLCNSGDFLVAEMDAKVGRYGIVPEELDGAIVSSHYFLFEIDDNKLNRSFLDYYLRTPHFHKQILARGSTNYASIRPGQVLEYMIPLPSISEQQKIVAKIEELAAKIEVAETFRQEVKSEVEKFSKSSELTIFRKQSEFYPREPLANLISMSSGEQLNKTELSDSYKFAVYGGGGYVGRYYRFLFEKPKIGIGRVGARCGCIYITEPRAWITDNSLYISEFSDRVEMNYLVFSLRSLDLRQYANQAAQPVISQKKIDPLKIPIPPKPEQQRIIGYLNRFQEKISELKQQQDQTAIELDALLPSILDKAFKGEL